MGDRRRRVAVLISGRGSNLGALLEATRRPAAAAEIVEVISDRPDAAGLDRARGAGLPAVVVARSAHPDRGSFEQALQDSLDARGTELICLAGFMRILSPAFVARWRDRILNVHPSLLPAFRGLDTHRRALEAGVRLHGCTVHLVRAEVDAGPILVQGAVPVLPGDDPATLAARVLEVEHRCYPLALELMAAGRVRVEGERALIDAPAPDGRPLINPPA
ncbi:MAG TPA: phosphoribosylglycinamide formyltransferase [Geminicoccaceae bacterium]